MSFIVDSKLPDLLVCPQCGGDWDGGSILDTFLKFKEDGAEYYKDMTKEQIEQEVLNSYSPPYRWHKLIGVELPYTHPNHYDGISFWQCPHCNTIWDRFTEQIVQSF